MDFCQILKQHHAKKSDLVVPMDMVNDRHPKMTGCKQICISEGLSLSVQRSERNFDIMFDININININKHNCYAHFDIYFLTLSTQYKA